MFFWDFVHIHIYIYIYIYNHTYIFTFTNTSTHNSIHGWRGRRVKGGKGVRSVALVLYSMHATLCYSIAQHMFLYAVSESSISICLWIVYLITFNASQNGINRKWITISLIRIIQMLWMSIRFYFSKLIKNVYKFALIVYEF